MKQQLLSKILILHLIFAVFAPFCLAQNTNTATSNSQNTNIATSNTQITNTVTSSNQNTEIVENTKKTEVLGEDERLPFMQTGENAESQEPSSGGLLLRTLGAMLLIVGLIFFGAWGAKKLGFGGIKSNASPDDLELTILTSVSLGSGRTISTLRFGERVLLVGSTAQAFTLLAEEETRSEKKSLQTSRSVAEMLAEENNSFEDEFEQAQTKLSIWEEKGERI